MIGGVAGLPRRRVVVVSDRYPPDTAGGAERSLHLALREPILRDQTLVVTFDAAFDRAQRRRIDGVEVLALPAPAAWPLHRRTQAHVDALKRRRFGLKWLAFAQETLALVAADPRAHGRALALHLAARPPGGVAMDHATVPGGRMEADLAAVLDRIRPDLVHADNARAILVAAGALGKRAIPFVALVRDHRFTSTRFDQTFGAVAAAGWAGRWAGAFAHRSLAFRRAQLRRADKVLATSGFLAETLRPLLEADRLAQLPLVPVEPSFRTSDAGDGCADGVDILVVGGLTSNKGQIHLLEAWPEIVARIPGARIAFAGRGPSHDALRRLIARFGAEDRVRLLGQVDDDALAALYQASDIVALPTLWAEPFGRVPLEAGAAGRPVVAYASGGLTETVVDGVTGRLVATGDRTAFIAALEDLADDPAMRTRLGEAGRARVQDAFAPAKLARELAAVWDALIDRP